MLLGMVFSLALICLITVLGTRAFMRNYVERYDGEIFLTGITIDDVDVSGKTMNQALDELRSKLRVFQSRSVTFNLENGRSFSGTLGDIGLNFDSLEAVAREAFDYRRDVSLSQRMRILRRSNNGRLELEFPLTYGVSEEELREFLESHMEEHLNTPVNARLESGLYGVTIIPDQIGEIFDFNKAYQGIYDYISTYWDGADITFNLEVIHEEADVVASQLEEMTDLLGTFTTTFYESTPSRAQNVETGASHINHLFMAPGDELSACTLMRPYTEENGYAYGPMFAGNMVIDAIGGGVCQVVSTLYIALLHAEVEIVQRNSHSMPVEYVPLSMDAAVAEDILDLRWRNNNDTPIYIESVVIPGQRITYNIFGVETRPENRRIELVNESTWGDAPEGDQFVASQYGIGAMWLISEARAPITARLFKVIFIDEEEVERIQVNSSYYQESSRIWSVGTASDNPDSTARMLGAIGSQSYEYVRSTISQILSGGYVGEQ
jgi:vancomycin resistance protein YoaR